MEDVVSATVVLRSSRAASHPFRGMRLLYGAYIVLFIVFMLAPLVVVVGSSFDPRELLEFPPHGFSGRWYVTALGDEAFVSALKTSLIVATLATLGSLVLGIPAAYSLARRHFPGRALLSGLLVAPLFVPELVIGVALLQILAVLPVAGIGTIAILVPAHILICLPYAVRTVHAAILGLDPKVEEAALNLGASKFATYRTVILPILRPALYAAILFAFLVSFDDTVLTLFLVSSRTMTLPVAIYQYVQYSLDPSISAIATVLMVVSVLIMFVASRLGYVGRISK